MQYPVDLHTHTIESHHAYSTIYEYVQIAKANGTKMFATTDHGPDLTDGAHPFHFNNMVVIPRICEGIAVLRGAEGNIRNDGTIDLTDYHMTRLDIVLAGFHPCYEVLSKEKNTEIYIKLIRSGLADVITHPGSTQYPFDYEPVLEEAFKHNVAIEINGSSDMNTRKGSTQNCIEIEKLCKKIGTRIALGSDAHICYGLSNFSHCMEIIRATDISDDMIINTSPVKVLDFLESRGHKRIEELREFFK